MWSTQSSCDTAHGTGGMHSKIRNVKIGKTLWPEDVHTLLGGLNAALYRSLFMTGFTAT